MSFPAIKSKYPDATVTVLGRDPVSKLKACIARTVGADHIDFVDDYARFLDDDWIDSILNDAARVFRRKCSRPWCWDFPW